MRQAEGVEVRRDQRGGQARPTSPFTLRDHNTDRETGAEKGSAADLPGKQPSADESEF